MVTGPALRRSRSSTERRNDLACEIALRLQGACCKKSDVLKIGRFARSYDLRIGRFKSALNGCKKLDVLETSDSVYSSTACCKKSDVLETSNSVVVQG